MWSEQPNPVQAMRGPVAAEPEVGGMPPATVTRQSYAGTGGNWPASDTCTPPSSQVGDWVICKVNGEHGVSWSAEWTVLASDTRWALLAWENKGGTPPTVTTPGTGGSFNWRSCVYSIFSGGKGGKWSAAHTYYPQETGQMQAVPGSPLAYEQGVICGPMYGGFSAPSGFGPTFSQGYVSILGPELVAPGIVSGDWAIGRIGAWGAPWGAAFAVWWTP
jgi:hypothetical protein